MNYDIIHSNTIEDLAKRVNAKIREGWQPIGGCNNVVMANSVVYTQAVINLPVQTQVHPGYGR